MKKPEPLTKCPKCGRKLWGARSSESIWLKCPVHGKVTKYHDNDYDFTIADIDFTDSIKEKPQRPYELVINIGGDTLRDIAHALENLAFDIENRSDCDIDICSGSPSAGYSAKGGRTSTVDHDAYIKQLNEYLDDCQKKKAQK